LADAAGRVTAALRSGDPRRIAEAANTYPRTAAEVRDVGWHLSECQFREVARTPHLKRVQIEVSLKCNLRCSSCYSESGPAQKSALTCDEILRVISQADELGVLALDFTGGELLMDPEWPTYVEQARRAGIEVTIHTNGTLLRPSVVEALKALGVAAVQVSVDSHLADVHDTSRGSRGALRRKLAGLDRIVDSGVPLRLALMAHRRNLDTVGDAIGYYSKRYPAAMLNVDRVVATGGAKNSCDGLTSDEFWDLMRPYISPGIRPGRICDSPGIDEFEPDCGVAYSFVYVTAQGEFAVCPTMTSRESRAFTGPSLYEMSLGEAWYDSSFFNSFRYTNCENVTTCVAGKRCGGGCRSNAYVESGSTTAPDLFACNTNKNSGKVFIDFLPRYAAERKVPAR
jgi:radical SAM protein with 4Fe4S-binding SPASM domain